MKHYTDPGFWTAYSNLRPEIRRLARQNYKRLVAGPAHPSLRFKRGGPYRCARIGLKHRALAVKDAGLLLCLSDAGRNLQFS